MIRQRKQEKRGFAGPDRFPVCREKAGRLLAGILTAGMCLGSMPGCPVAAEEEKSGMGRYVESELTLPENVHIVGFKTTEDEKLQILGLTIDDASEETDNLYSLWESEDAGDSWQKITDYPELGREDYLTSAALDGKGNGAAVSMRYPSEEDSSETEATIFDYTFEFLSFDREGNVVRENSESEELKNMGFRQLQFSRDGRLLALTYSGSVIELNSENGELLETLYDGDGMAMGLCGQEVFILDYQNQLQHYDMEAEEMLSRDEILENVLFQGGNNYDSAVANTMPIVFTEDGAGRLFYCTQDGIFGYAPGGSVVEQIVEGELTSLSDPSVYFQNFAVCGQAFYVVYISDGTSGILKYEYSPDIPSKPQRELSIYSLEENSAIRQAAVQFRKKYPDTYVKYECGLSGEDGVTTSDALRTLNTDILAGNGPDILILDGMPVETYAEKGILADLKKILAETENNEGGVLKNIAYTYQMGDTVPAVPTAFRIPMIVGPQELADAETGLDALAEIAAGTGNLGYFDIMQLQEILYPVCAGAWKTEDGTIDREKLSEYVNGIVKIGENWVSNASDQDKTSVETYSGGEFNVSTVMVENGLNGYYDGDLAFGMLSLFGGECRMKLGVLADLLTYGGFCSIGEQKGDCVMAMLQGQQSGVFIPGGIIGMLSNAREQERAEQFVRYVLSQEGQSMNQGNGFPVNLPALEEYEKNSNEGGDGSYTVVSENTETGMVVELNYEWPSKEDLGVFEMIVYNELDTRADMDQVQKEVVLEETNRCLSGEISADEAVNSIMQKINLYLAE